MNFDPDTTALLVVDMQNDFCHPDGALYSPASEAVIEPINGLIMQARQSDIPVLFTADTHTDEQFEDAYYNDEYERWTEHCEAGSWGWNLHDSIKSHLNDHIITKPTYDAFHETRLDEILSDKGITDLVIVGTLANVCVLHTAASAGKLDYRPVIAENCVGYIEEAQKDRALEHADFLFGEVTDSESISFEGE